MKDSYLTRLKNQAPPDSDTNPKATPSPYQKFKSKRFLNCLSNIEHHIIQHRFDELKTSELTFDGKCKLIGEEWRLQGSKNKAKLVRT